MKLKRISSILLLMMFFSITILSVNFDVGMSVLTNNIEPGFNMALRTGFRADNFDFSFDFRPSFDEGINLVSITDVSANLANFNNSIIVSGGILWINDNIDIEIEPDENDDEDLDPIIVSSSSININIGITYNIDTFYAKLYLMYPLSGAFIDLSEGLNLTDFFALKFTYYIPKPANFKDDLIIEFRFTRFRRDFSLFLSTPFGF